MERLLSFVEGALGNLAEQETASSLGDRTSYVGMSDIGRAMNCPRAALANRTCRRALSLNHMLTLQRGHWFEEGIGRALLARHPETFSQLEIVPQLDIPVRAHLDFVLVTTVPVPTVRVLELKSTACLPQTLNASYEAQVYGQIGLLHRFWSEPAFSCAKSARMTFPELCRMQFGVELPEQVEDVDLAAHVLSLSMTEARAFGPYKPDTAMLELCMETAGQLWSAQTKGLSLNDMDYARGWNPLCSCCEWSSDCPKFSDASSWPCWDTTLGQLDELKAKGKALESEIAEIEDGLKAAYTAVNPDGGWISTGSHRFRVAAQAGRRSLDRERLRSELQARLGLDEADALLSQCEKEGQPFERLAISKVKLSPSAEATAVQCAGV